MHSPAAARTKVKEPRLIPLSPLAVGVIAALPVIGAFVFSSRGDKPFGHFTRVRAQLDALITRQRAETRSAAAAWGAPGRHRRTAALAFARSAENDATGLQRLGVRLEVIEAVLGHVSGSRSGIVAVYQRHKFEAEAREALVAWGAHVQRLLDGDTAGAEVVPLRRA